MKHKIIKHTYSWRVNLLYYYRWEQSVKVMLWLNHLQLVVSRIKEEFHPCQSSTTWLKCQFKRQNTHIMIVDIKFDEDRAS